MKRVKIMLMAILMLAILGGALAFKAKCGDICYCTAEATTVNGIWTCEDPAHKGFCYEPGCDLTDDGPGLKTICTREMQPFGDPCPDDLECESTTELQTFE